MKASELIRKLERAIEKRGDIDVLVATGKTARAATQASMCGVKDDPAIPVVVIIADGQSPEGGWNV
jgi:hypothetical protein